MTTARLAARLDRVSARIRVPEPVYRVDLNLLSGAEADRFVALGYAYETGEASQDEKEELGCLLRASQTLTSDGRMPPPFPVPSSLQRYWRLQKFANTGFSLPGGNYRFHELSFEGRERLMDLSLKYGWQPEVEIVTIAHLTEWEEDDLKALCDLMWLATSENERDMWERKDNSK